MLPIGAQLVREVRVSRAGGPGPAEVVVVAEGSNDKSGNDNKTAIWIAVAAVVAFIVIILAATSGGNEVGQ